MSTPAAATLRRQVIGGTDISAIIGVNSYRTVHQVYAEKVGLDMEDEVDREAAEMGQLLEVPIGRKYQRETGFKIRRPAPDAPPGQRSFLRHPTIPWFGGSPDYRVIGQARMMDCKSARFTEKWGEAGTDEVPLQYLVQAHWYNKLTDSAATDIAVLFGVHDFRIYTVIKDQELEGILLQRAEKFWHDHVERQVPPPPDASYGSGRLLALLHPQEKGEDLLVATDEENEMARALAAARAASFIADAEKSRLENTLKARIGEAPGISGGVDGQPWRITWKKAKDSAKVDWVAVSTDLCQKYSIPPEALGVIVSEHTATRFGARRFVTDRKFFPQESTMTEREVLSNGQRQ